MYGVVKSDDVEIDKKKCKEERMDDKFSKFRSNEAREYAHGNQTQTPTC